MGRTLGVLATAAIGALVLSGCGGAAADAAQAAYDECSDADADAPLFRLDGNTVHVELRGDNARQLGNMPNIGDQLDRNVAVQDLDLSGFGVGISLLVGLECMAEHTGFPGRSADMNDGDEWEGWRFSYERGAGSEETHSFQSTL